MRFGIQSLGSRKWGLDLGLRLLSAQDFHSLAPTWVSDLVSGLWDV